MSRTCAIGFVVLASAACGTQAPTSPSALSSATSFTDAGALQARGACVVDVGSTQHPLPAVHELEGWLNEATAATSGGVTCGVVSSLDAKMDALARALDTEPPNHDAACGISGALVNELESLVRREALATPTFPPPFPGGPTNVLAAAQALNEQWCAAARGDLEGPRS